MHNGTETGTAAVADRPESQSEKAYQEGRAARVTFGHAQKHAASEYYCGRGAIVGMSRDGQTIVVVPVRCKKWVCDSCGPIRQHRTAARIAAGLPNKFITLTTRKGDGSTAQERFDKAKQAFPILVKRIRAQFGSFDYACVWELSKAGSAHAHVAARADFIPQRWLSAQWAELTGSEIVDIRAVRDVRKVAYYVVKYMLKAAADTNRVLAGRRLLQFSATYDLDVDPTDPQPEGVEWVWTWVDKGVVGILSDLELTILDWRITKEDSGVITCERRPAGERAVSLEFKASGELTTLHI